MMYMTDIYHVYNYKICTLQVEAILDKRLMKFIFRNATNKNDTLHATTIQLVSTQYLPSLKHLSRLMSYAVIKFFLTWGCSKTRSSYMVFYLII